MITICESCEYGFNTDGYEYCVRCRDRNTDDEDRIGKLINIILDMQKKIDNIERWMRYGGSE